MRRAGILVLLALAGALVAAVGTFLHAARLAVGPVDVPYGVVASLGLTAAAVAGGGLLIGARSGALAAALGWLAVLVLSLSPGPGGDVPLPAQPLSYVWLLGGLVVVGIALGAPYAELVARRRKRPPAEVPRAPTS